MLDKKIGIIGGGQLGKMMILEAKRMGFWVAVLDPSSDCPASGISDKLIVADFNDKNAMARLGSLCDCITYEFEHIGAEHLVELKNGGAVIYPSPESLQIIQNKYSQKLKLKEGGAPVPEFLPVDSIESVYDAGEKLGYPLMLKAATGGYDGKGNFVINDRSRVPEGFETLGGGALPLMAEKMVDFQMEVSVLACRGINGEIKVFPVGKNTHKDNILEETIVPAPLPVETLKRAMDIASLVMDIFEGVGIFCVEMFVDKEGLVLVNEVAPRPHNSGHYTIEACVTNQFEQHIRAICGLPLGDTGLIRPAAMRNILGEVGHSGKAVVQGACEALSVRGSKLHIYGKTETRPKRKMGHITVTADTAKEATALCEKAAGYIKITT